MFWHDDEFRYGGARGSWDDDRNVDDPPTRGYVEDVQRHIDDGDLDPFPRRVQGGELPWRG